MEFGALGKSHRFIPFLKLGDSDMKYSWLLVLTIVAVLIPGAASAKNNKKVQLTDTYPLAECQFSATGSNQAFYVTRKS
jgi:hypothetical protein